MLGEISCDTEAFDPVQGNFDNVFYEDRDHFLYALQVNGRVLQYGSEEFRSDRELVKVACIGTGAVAFQYASDEIKSDLSFVKELIWISTGLIAIADEKLLHDKDFLASLPDRMLEYLLEEDGPDWLRDDKEFALKMIANTGCTIEYLSEKLRDDYDIALAAVKSFGRQYRYVSEKLKMNRNVAKAAFLSGGGALEYAPDAIKADRELVKIALNSKGSDLKYASDDLKADRELVKIALSSYGGGLMYLSDKYKGDKELVTIAVGSNSQVNDAFVAMADELKRDKEFIKSLLFINCDVLDYADSELSKDAELKFLYKIQTL